MPERRAASLVPEVADQLPPVIEWGTLAGEGNFLAQSGDVLQTQSGDDFDPQSG